MYFIIRFLSMNSESVEFYKEASGIRNKLDIDIVLKALKLSD